MSTTLNNLHRAFNPGVDVDAAKARFEKDYLEFKERWGNTFPNTDLRPVFTRSGLNAGEQYLRQVIRDIKHQREIEMGFDFMEDFH